MHVRSAYRRGGACDAVKDKRPFFFFFTYLKPGVVAPSICRDQLFYLVPPKWIGWIN
jgi:hypothetical protein